MSTISFETVIWLVRYVIFASIMIVVWFIVAAALILSINVQDVESQAFISRALYSENLNYVDETGRVHPGVIDMNKFYQGNFGKEFIYSEERALAAKIVLYELGRGGGVTIFYNKKWYDNWKPLVGIEGKGGVSFVKKNASVMIKDESSFKNGALEFNIIIPNT